MKQVRDDTHSSAIIRTRSASPGISVMSIWFLCERNYSAPKVKYSQKEIERSWLLGRYDLQRRPWPYFEMLTITNTLKITEVKGWGLDFESVQSYLHEICNSNCRWDSVHNITNIVTQKMWHINHCTKQRWLTIHLVWNSTPSAHTNTSNEILNTLLQFSPHLWAKRLQMSSLANI